MKKLIAVTLLLAMVLSMAACGTSKDDVTGKLDPVPATNATTEETAEAPAETTEATVETTEATEAATQAATDATESQNPVSMGRMEGGVYTNTYAGFACTLDENWTFMSAEELQDIPENIAQILEGTEVGESMDSLTQFTDMMAENLTALCSMNVLYQKHTAQQQLAYMMLSDEQLLDETLKNSDLMKESYAQMGIEVQAFEKKTVTFLGQERVALHTSSTMNGVPYYTLQLFEFHKGAYGVTLTLSCFQEDKTESMLELFYAAE